MEDEKFIDESWKDAVEKEKEVQSSKPQEASSHEPLAGGEPSEGPEGVPEVNFIGYITSLAFQAMIFMGEIPNPLTNETDKNLMQSKFLIDTLILIKEKTKANLSSQESDTLSGFIYELQTKFVEVVQKEQNQQNGGKP